MDSIKGLLRDSSIYGLTELLNRGMQVLLLPLIFIFLNKQEFGILDYFLTIKNLAVVFLGIGLSTVIQRYKMWEADYSLNMLASTALFTIVFLDGIYLIISSLFSAEITILLVNTDYSLEWILVNITSIFFAIRTIPLGILRLQQKPLHFLIVSLSNFIIYFIATFVLLKLEFNGYLSFLWGALIAITFSLISGLYLTKNEISFKFNLSLSKTLIAFGLSILSSSSTVIILNSLNRFFLKADGSFEDLAILGLSTRLSIIVGAFLVAPFNLAWLPYAAKNYKEPKFRVTYDKIVTGFIIIGMLMVLGLSFFTKELLLLIGQIEYINSARIIPFYALTFIFQGLYFLSTSSIFLEGFKSKYYIISLATVVTNILIYLAFGDFINIYTVSSITLVGFIIMFIIGNRLASSQTRISYMNPLNMSVLVFGSLISFISIEINDVLQGPMFVVGKVLVMVILFLIIYFALGKEVRKIFKSE